MHAYFISKKFYLISFLKESSIGFSYNSSRRFLKEEVVFSKRIAIIRIEIEKCRCVKD